MNKAPERGITITPAELASDGTETVLDIVAGTGANAITTATGLAIEAQPGEGVREPPLDIAGDNRILDRPLWGKRVTHVRRYAVHEPDPALWRKLPWDPPEVAPEEIRVDYPRQAIDLARERGISVYLQLTPYSLPGGTGGQEATTASTQMRDEYRPQRFIGGSHPDAIAFTGCLNNPTVRQLGRTRMTELLRHYADVDGIVLDWVEYPPYFLDKAFTCFCDHCQRQATALGYDWQEIRGAVRHLWDSIHATTPEQVRAMIESGDWGDLVAHPEVVQDALPAWLRFKGDSVTLAVQDLRNTMDAAGATDLTLCINGSALPWGRMSGASLPRSGGAIDIQRVKLYSFHWLMMVRWWAETLLTWNRGAAIQPSDMTRAMLALFNMELMHPQADMEPAAFGMPGPEDSHNLTAETYSVRLENALTLLPKQAPLYPIVHAYRSVDDFALVLEAVRPFARRGIWIQRYGYLSDAKIDVLTQEWARSP